MTAETALPHCGHTRVYFPGTGLCSIINKMADGGGIEVACVGSEGVVGLHALAEESTIEIGFVQVADGTVQYLPLCCSSASSRETRDFREIIDSFSHSFLETMIQAVACNRLHTTERAMLPLAAQRARSSRARPIRAEGTISRACDGREELRRHCDP